MCSNRSAEKQAVSRRDFVAATTLGIATSAFAGLGTARAAERSDLAAVRWGFVGTGNIANSMARTLKLTAAGNLTASSSRTMAKAQAFASQHGAKQAFDSWEEMIEWDGIDAVYVATPTSVREEISVAAANAGKHVLGEKPFASLPSLRNILDACRQNDVAFMDGTHFTHHPRTENIRGQLDSLVGVRRSVNSVFQVKLDDPSNIRMQPQLEPMGAVGDIGWYNMRAIVEYLGPNAKLRDAAAYLRRDSRTGAAIGASGVISFSDGTVSNWSCGFDAGAKRIDASVDGKKGSVEIADFHRHDKDGSASFRYRSGLNREAPIDDVVTVESSLPAAVLMFEEFAAQVSDKSLRNRSMSKSDQTQMLLDAVWESAIENESGAS